MGSVWVANDTHLGRDVAIKVMVPAAFALADLVARFEREARAAAQIQSRHVVQIFDHGFDGGQPFIVMELLEGEDLAARLRGGGRLSLDQTAQLVSDVCTALRAAHKIGVVHRDLKPANVFLARQDGGEVVKVLDFGVAKLTGADAERTQTHALLGTPHYMAPEQARDTGAPVDHRADLWSVAVIAFRALTGRLPFVGDNQVKVLVAVASQAAPAPSSIAPELGPEVDRFFATAFTRDRALRFQSAEALRDAIMGLGARASHNGAPNNAGQPLSSLRTTLPLTAEAAQLRKTMPLPEPPPTRKTEPTPAVNASTPFSRRNRGDMKWVVWLAGGAALIVTGVAVGTTLAQSRADSAVGSTATPATPAQVATAAPSALPSTTASTTPVGSASALPTAETRRRINAPAPAPRPTVIPHDF